MRDTQTTQGIQPLTLRPPCPNAYHRRQQESEQTFRALCKDVRKWPGEPLLMGECRHCRSTLTIEFRPNCFEAMDGLTDASKAELEAEWAKRWPRGEWVRGTGVVA